MTAVGKFSFYFITFMPFILNYKHHMENIYNYLMLSSK